MTLLFGFAPFLLFAILSRLSADLALWLAFAAAFVVTVRDFVESPSLRLLDGASLVLFGLLALGRGFLMPELSLAAVRTIVEAGLCLVILASLLRGRPFSLQYASQDSKSGSWPLPVFLRVNRLISLVWGAGFAVMTLADAGGHIPACALLCRHRHQRGGAGRRHHFHLALSRAGGQAAGALTSRRQHPLSAPPGDPP